jgi:hypothetical protein
MRNDLRTTNQHKKSLKNSNLIIWRVFWLDWRHIWRENGEMRNDFQTTDQHMNHKKRHFAHLARFLAYLARKGSSQMAH